MARDACAVSPDKNSASDTCAKGEAKQPQRASAPAAKAAAAGAARTLLTSRVHRQVAYWQVSGASASVVVLLTAACQARRNTVNGATRQDA